MEQDNQSNEHLERFLHRAFDQFSANPPDALWNRIQGNMQPVQPPVKGILLKPWHLAAAARVVLLLLAGQHFYFQTQIEQIHQQLSAEVSNTILTPPSPAIPAAPATAPAAVAAQLLQQPAEAPRGTFSGDNSVKKNTAKITTVHLPFYGETASFPLPVANAATAIMPQTADKDAEAIAESKAATPTHVINYFRANSLPLAVSNTRPQASLQAVMWPVQVSRQNKKWSSAGVHVLPGNAYLSVASNNKGPDNGQPNPQNDPLFTEDTPTKGTLLVAGITAEKTIRRHWSLVAGLDYTEQQFSKTIKPRLRFGDRRNGPGGGHDPHDHNFDYDVATGSGTWSVNVEVRESDTGSSSTPLQDDDPVTFSIKTNEKVQILSAPLLLKYHTTYKHWNVFASAGLRLNTILKQQENITGFSSESERLTIKGEPQISRPDKAAQRTLTLDYSLSGGVEYRTGPLGFSVAPVFTAPVIKPVKDDRISVNNYWAGVNMGVQYYF